MKVNRSIRLRWLKVKTTTSRDPHTTPGQKGHSRVILDTATQNHFVRTPNIFLCIMAKQNPLSVRLTRQQHSRFRPFLLQLATMLGFGSCGFFVEPQSATFLHSLHLDTVRRPRPAAELPSLLSTARKNPWSKSTDRTVEDSGVLSVRTLAGKSVKVFVQESDNVKTVKEKVAVAEGWREASSPSSGVVPVGAPESNDAAIRFLHGDGSKKVPEDNVTQNKRASRVFRLSVSGNDESGSIVAVSPQFDAAEKICIRPLWDALRSAERPDKTLHTLAVGLGDIMDKLREKGVTVDPLDTIVMPAHGDDSIVTKWLVRDRMFSQSLLDSFMALQKKLPLLNANETGAPGARWQGNLVEELRVGRLLDQVRAVGMGLVVDEENVAPAVVAVGARETEMPHRQRPCWLDTMRASSSVGGFPKVTVVLSTARGGIMGITFKFYEHDAHVVGPESNGRVAAVRVDFTHKRLELEKIGGSW